MRKWLNWIGGFIGFSALFFVFLFTARWALQEPKTGCSDGVVIHLTGPFSKLHGLAYAKHGLSDSGDTTQAITSTLLLCEGNLPLGPAHSLHADIANEGRGRFSHWGNSMIFSTSDNSDPNENGRIYKIVQPR